jgi:mRNA-degrading endonuclease toxin of MazEF toxin-antitoxin module
MPVVEWRDAGLAMDSVARVDKLSAMSKALVRRSLGRLNDEDARRPGIRQRR